MIAHHFLQLDTQLYAHRHWWQFRPFHLRDYPWGDASLAQWLTDLTDEAIWALDSDADALAQALVPWLGDAPMREIRRLCSAYDTVVSARSPVGESAAVGGAGSLNDGRSHSRLGQGIPGKKWLQIQAFSQRVLPGEGPLLEWCAGKGHLGRLMASLGARAVTSIEWQPALCQAGAELAQAAQLPQQFVQADVMVQDAEILAHVETVVALHACGDLHRKLLQLFAQNLARATEPAAELTPLSLHLAPCCYHLQSQDHYPPLSRQGQQSSLALTRADLSQAMQQTVTAGARDRRLRDQELQWRMAFDELQRELRGNDAYLPLPNIPKGLLTGDFARFIDWALAQKQLSLPAEVSLDEFMGRGRQRAQKVRRMELVAKVFRRPLELWLVLDRACFLQESGAQVRVIPFCDFSLTPRNLLIQAQRKCEPRSNGSTI